MVVIWIFWKENVPSREVLEIPQGTHFRFVRVRVSVYRPLTALCLRCAGGGGDDADLPVSAVLSRRAHSPAHRRGRPQGGRHRVV